MATRTWSPMMPVLINGSPVLEANPPPEHLLIPIYLSNRLHGETHGIEMFANYAWLTWRF